MVSRGALLSVTAMAIALCKPYKSHAWIFQILFYYYIWHWYATFFHLVLKICPLCLSCKLCYWFHLPYLQFIYCSELFEGFTDLTHLCLNIVWKRTPLFTRDGSWIKVWSLMKLWVLNTDDHVVTSAHVHDMHLLLNFYAKWLGQLFLHVIWHCMIT